ncbi:replicative helicase loader/inhibitor [Neobacillus sp. YIM B06451]|uniref:replicative helicase loader/inhibitor n=1 Tax=Neobacillus sp. YIM B06451 TaxID=3070994 RepID=UPI00293086B8|nr:replicative helicase loader/inhibitor [Neobacillus sp. YIM B06451]
MEKHELMKILVLIESVYPEFTVKDETVENWFAVCREMDYSLVMKKLSAHIRKSPYPPLMAEIAVYNEDDLLSGREGMLLEEEGWIQMKHDSLLPKEPPQMPWQNEYFAGL